MVMVDGKFEHGFSVLAPSPLEGAGIISQKHSEMHWWPAGETRSMRSPVQGPIKTIKDFAERGEFVGRKGGDDPPMSGATLK